MTSFVVGKDASEHFNGGSGTDIIDGGGGNDRIDGGSGDDILNGGAGSDRVSGGSGNDTLVYVAANNAGATDIYDGGSGIDLLALVFTRAEWMKASVQGDIARYLAFIARETNANNGQASNAEFRFSAFDLRVSKIEAFVVVVDGVILDPRDAGVTLAADVLTATADTAGVAVDLLANDRVPDLVRTVTHTQGAFGAVVVTLSTDAGRAATARATYTPDAAHWKSLAAGETGTDTFTFTYTVTDADGDVSTQTVTVTITGTNDAPVASVDTAAGTENQSLVVDVLANDTDVDKGAILTLTAAQAPASRGTAAVVDNRLAFAPGTDFDHLKAGATEVVIVSYAIRDEHGATATASVTITVTGTNDGPVVTSSAAAARGNVIAAGHADDGAVLAGTPSATGALTSTDIDDGATATWSGTANGALGGFATSASGVWTYTIDRARAASLAKGEVRTESFTATVTDDAGATATQVVNITVTGTNDAPVVTSGTASGAVVEAGRADDGAVVAGTPVAAGMLTASDADAGARLVWSGTAEGVHGGFVVGEDGAWTYTLANASAATQALGVGETRTETFLVTVADAQGATATQVVTVNIAGTNDAPTIAMAATTASGAITQGSGQSASGRIAFADPDANDTHVATATPRNPDAIGSLTLGAVDQAGNAVGWSFAATDGAFDFLAAGETRTQMYDVATADGHGGTATQAVTVTIAGTNDAPTIVLSQTTATAAITEGASATHKASGSVGFADVDSIDVHTAGVVAEGANYLGALVVGDVDQVGNRVGWSFAVPDGALDALAAGETLIQTYTLSVADGQGGVAQQRITVTITGTNDAPVVTGAATGTAIEDGAASTLNALANASDVDANARLSVRDVPATLPAGVTFDAATNSFTLDPSAYQSLAAGQSTTVSVTYGVSDGTATTPASVSWTVTGTNDAPMVSGAVVGAATEGGAASTLGALANASDIDAGTTLAIVDVPVTLPKGVTYDAATRAFTLDPATYGSLGAGETVTIVVDYGVSDGIATTPATAGWTVTGANGAPVVTGAVMGTAVEDGASSTLNALANASDGDQGTVLQVVDVPGTLPAGVRYDAAARSFSLDPAAYQSLAAGQNMTVSVTYGVSDGTATTSASVSWTVTGTNDAPVVTGSSNGAIKEDVGVGANGQVGATGVISYTDPDARGTTTVSVAGAADTYLGTFAAAVAQDGRVTWSFTADNAKLQHLRGTQTLVQDYQVTIDDGQGGRAVQTVSVTIGGTNDAIVRSGTPETIFTEVDGVTIGSIRFHFTDADVGDVHTGVASKRVADSIGSITSSPIGQEADGRYYIDVEYRHDDAEVDALPADLLDWRYQVRISDNAGDEEVFNRIVTLNGVEYYIGDESNEYVGLPAEQRSVVIGGGGSDRLYGGSLDDALFGDDGPDLPSTLDNSHVGTAFAGNTYDDLLNGGDGADTLTGGAGADVFEFSFDEAQGDIVTDFTRGEGDRLYFGGWGPGATFTKVDATHWELANGDRSVVEIITFANAPEILVTDYLFY